MNEHKWVPKSTLVGATTDTDALLAQATPLGGYFRRLARCIHKYSHGAPFFSVTMDEEGKWYTFISGEGVGNKKTVLPVHLSLIDPAQTEAVFGHLAIVETTYDQYIDLKYIKNIVHKLTTDERRRIQRWVESGKSIEKI